MTHTRVGRAAHMARRARSARLAPVLLAIVTVMACTPTGTGSTTGGGIVNVGQGVVDNNSSTYMYAPSFIQTPDGLLHYYACWGVAGDWIGHKQASSLAGLVGTPLGGMLAPSNQLAFDRVHVCDPSIIRSAANGQYYLHYSGEGGVGVAVSSSASGPFTKLGQYLARPPGTAAASYGRGQSSITLGPDGYYYNIFTNQIGPLEPNSLIVLRSADPSFLNGFTEVARLNPDEVGGWSVSMHYDASVDRFLIVVNGGNQFVVRSYDRSFHLTGSESYPVFANLGEGVAMLSDVYEHPIRLNGELVFTGATVGNRAGFPPTITGPNIYARFTK